MLPVHYRMQVIVSPDVYAALITGEAQDALDLVRPYPPDEMQTLVSKRVSRSGEEGPDLIRPDDGEYSD
jgi:putative SOS response-associated peptidase YedK